MYIGASILHMTIFGASILHMSNFEAANLHMALENRVGAANLHMIQISFKRIL